MTALRHRCPTRRPPTIQRRAVTALVTSAALSVALVACGSGPGDDSAADAPQTPQQQFDLQPYDNVRDGGTLRIGLSEVPQQLNVFHGDTSGYSGNLWPWSNPQLVSYDADGTPRFDPDYVTDARARTVDGNTQMTYTFNPEAVFNDGTPIDWHVLVETQKVLSGKPSSTRSSGPSPTPRRPINRSLWATPRGSPPCTTTAPS